VYADAMRSPVFANRKRSADITKSAVFRKRQDERVVPRLLNMRQAAEYLGCSFWTVRDYILQNLIPVVELPPLRPREGERPRKKLRRILVDQVDLDAFIEARKRP